ncbi:hypothetical protein [Sphingobium sp. BS19]|uniref:hypothetical protein n=1 Tax=Sphingobium sp. BS19 TaxID=3018973 RepID=UPI0022EE008B|nr:hypothetical protein [Sphingobium sp. BS19]GLI98890.1 hypothetical protein Sbs19_27080 [Sphingobium sp. BS19]
MVSTSIWTTYSKFINWDEARALAQKWGGDLTSNLNYDHSFYTDYDRFDGIGWVGVKKTNGDFYFLDGTKVRDKYPEDFYISPPRYDNGYSFNLQIGEFEGAKPERYGQLAENQLYFAEGADTNGVIWDVVGTSIKATSFNDVIEPADVSGRKIDMGAGNDFIHVEYDAKASSHLKLGTGDDRLYVDAIIDGAENIVVEDGDGEDFIDALGVKIVAALDGDNDTYFYASKLVYEGAKSAIYVENGFARGIEIGLDRIEDITEITTGSGNDVVSSSARVVYTKGGNDVISISGFAYGDGSFVLPVADAGDGNDMITVSGAGGRVIAGKGDDKITLVNWDGTGKVELTGGAGSDRFELAANETASSLRPIINDFAASGNVQDILDFTSYNLDATTVGDAIGKGLLTISRTGGYTYVGIEGSGEFADLTLMLKGSFGSEIQDNIWI